MLGFCNFLLYPNLSELRLFKQAIHSAPNYYFQLEQVLRSIATTAETFALVKKFPEINRKFSKAEDEYIDRLYTVR